MGREELLEMDVEQWIDRRPTRIERAAIMKGLDIGVRVKALYAFGSRCHDAGFKEGSGYASSPDLTLRRLLEGLQHVVSHVHHHCRHANDGLAEEPLNDVEGDESDTLPTGKSLPMKAGDRLSRNAWRRCLKDPCAGLVQIISDCRLWDALDSPVRHHD